MDPLSKFGGMTPPQATAQPATGDAADDVIKDTTTATFMVDVVDASKDVPVLVDFWAPWCGPCKQLTPVLEKVVRNAKGKVRLVKMNIDEHPDVAGQLRVQSIPTVYAFKNGQVADMFQGALPESQVIAFIERLVGAGAIEEDGVDVLISSGLESLEAGDTAGAAEIFAAVLQEQPEEPRALAGMARCYVEMGNVDQAEMLLSGASDEVQKSDAVAQVRSMISVAKQANEAGDTADLEARIAANPTDWQARFDLAVALNASGKRSAAIDALVEIISKNRQWEDEKARKQLVEFFEAWGPTDEATLEGRQKLSSVLFA